MKIKEVIDLHYSEFIFVVDVIDKKEIEEIMKALPREKVIYWKEEK